jgi:Holliday junction resolvase-like predicted endonuclease
MISLSKTTNFRQSLGKMGESVAQDFLISQAWAIDARNYYVHRRGEIDIIGRPPTGQVLAFIEVKTRQLRAQRGLDHPGQQSLHWAKQRRMSRAALSYLRDPAVANRPSILRFDLILVDIRLNYKDLKELLLLRDVQALKPHCLVTHLTNIMGTF